MSNKITFKNPLTLDEQVEHLKNNKRKDSYESDSAHPSYLHIYNTQNTTKCKYI